MQVSLTQIFDRPLRGREFFGEIIRDNLDLGRPDRVQLIFDRVVTKKCAQRVPYEGDSGRGASEPAHLIPELRSEPVLQGRSRMPDGGNLPQPE